ncbi:MAG: hypothetical protein QXE94_04145 [Candidatus Bathyarchaeia archaeon]
MRAEKEGAELGPLKEETIKEYKEKAKQRKELIRRMWRMFDTAGERKILEKMEELEREQQEE